MQHKQNREDPKKLGPKLFYTSSHTNGIILMGRKQRGRKGRMKEKRKGKGGREMIPIESNCI